MWVGVKKKYTEKQMCLMWDLIVGSRKKRRTKKKKQQQKIKGNSGGVGALGGWVSMSGGGVWGRGGVVWGFRWGG